MSQPFQGNFVADLEKFRVRYLRMTFNRPSDDIGQVGDEIQSSPISIPNIVRINLIDTVARCAPVKRCIYCGSSEWKPQSSQKLGDEHVVADGLGGTLILPESSCEKCSKATGKTEATILRTLLWAPRRRLNIRSKKRKKRIESFPLTTVVNGRNVEIMLPLEMHPTMLFMVAFERPRVLREGDPNDNISGVFLHQFGDPAALFGNGTDQVSSPAFDTVRFCQMLAKIAHGYAVLAYGYDRFIPLLTEFIVREFEKADRYPECYDYVGGINGRLDADSALHTLGHEIVTTAGITYLVVYIRLFANLEAPVYCVVAGTIGEAAN